MALCWTFFEILFGLIQLWVLLLISLLATKITFGLTDGYTDGLFLFFSMAVVASISLEFFFSRRHNLPTWAVGVMFAAYPLGTAVFITTAFVTLHVVPPSQLNQNAVSVVQMIGLGLALLYALVAKTVLFLMERT